MPRLVMRAELKVPPEPLDHLDHHVVVLQSSALLQRLRGVKGGLRTRTHTKRP